MVSSSFFAQVDQIQKYSKLNFNIDFYTDVLDLDFLVEQMADDPFTRKHKKLNSALTDLIQGYSLVNFVPLAINDKERMMNVKNHVDKANGFCFGSQVCVFTQDSILIKINSIVHKSCCFLLLILFRKNEICEL